MKIGQCRTVYLCVAGLLLGLLSAPIVVAADGTGGDWLSVYQVLPTGNEATSVLGIEQALPREIKQGVPFDYWIRVRNLTQCPLREVAISQQLPATITITTSSPRARLTEGQGVQWQLGDLEIGDTATIQVRALAGAVGALTFCCDATYRVATCVTVQSTQPALSLRLDTLAEATRCDEIPVRLTVSNTGTGSCRDVRMRYLLPDGLLSEDGRREYSFAIDSLPPGAARQATLRLRPARPGVYQHQATVRAAGGLSAEAGGMTSVTEPRLQVVQKGTKQQFAGRELLYSFTVTNTGDAVARNVVVQDILPAGVTVVGVSPGGGSRVAEGVVWRLPQLTSGATEEFTVRLRSTVAGTLNNRVTVTADCADDAGAQAESVVRGIAAILLEVIDLDDPIEVGGRETYVITATNQGSADGTNLTVRCELEENMSYHSSDGPTEAMVQGNSITFAPLSRLAPKERAVWTVTCNALTEGDVRFKVLLTSDQLSRPVEETEATHLY